MLYNFQRLNLCLSIKNNKNMQYSKLTFPLISLLIIMMAVAACGRQSCYCYINSR